MKEELIEPLWDELEEKARPLVYWMFSHGIATVQSCQGGECHAWQFPTVEIPLSSVPEDEARSINDSPMDYTYRRVLAILRESGFCDFFISRRIAYNQDLGTAFGLEPVYWQIVVEWYGHASSSARNARVRAVWTTFDLARKKAKKQT